MISVVFENGHKRVYKKANLLRGNSIYYKITPDDDDPEWVAFIPANAVIESMPADVVEGLDSDILKKSIAFIKETKVNGRLGYGEGQRMKELKRLLGEFNATEMRWKEVSNG